MHEEFQPHRPNLPVLGTDRVTLYSRVSRCHCLDGVNKIDTTYLDNAADAHLLALERLQPGAPIGGRAYFVTQDDPRPVREVIGMWLRAAGIPVQPRHVPLAVARVLARAVEFGYRFSGARSEPPLTRFLVRQLATAHWFDIGAARRGLGYAPRISTDEGWRCSAPICTAGIKHGDVGSGTRHRALRS